MNRITESLIARPYLIDQDNVVMHFLLIGRPILMQNPNACPVTIDDQETRAFSSLF